MPNSLTPAQESFAVTAQQIFTEDLFVGMLSPVVNRQLARGIAFGLPVERVMSSYRDKQASEIADYVKPYFNRAWQYFPTTKLLTEEFKDQVFALTVAAFEQEKQWSPAKPDLEDRLG